MTTDRLNELKDWRDELKEVNSEMVAMGYSSDDERAGHILLLDWAIRNIYAEQSRQSVTDDEATESIEWLKGEKSAYEIEADDADLMTDDGEPVKVTRETYLRLARLAQTAISALSAYRKPSADQAEQIGRAIETFESFVKSRYDPDWTGNSVSNHYLYDSASLAITALRRMAGEGK